MTVDRSRFGTVTDVVYESHILTVQEQLIKSQAFFVHRRAQQSTIVTILSLNAKTVPTIQKINWLQIRALGARTTET